MKMFRSALLVVLTALSVSPVVVASSSSLLRGSDSTTSQWSCILSAATDTASCLAVKDDTCSWCTISADSTGPGMCVNQQQKEIVEEKFHMTCKSSLDDDDDDDKAAADDDDATNNDDDFMDGLLSCLTHGDDKEECSKNAGGHDCVWCTSQQYGVCITKEASETVDTYKFFDCSGSDEFDEEAAVIME